MENEPKTALLLNAKSPAIASMLVQALRFEGIPAYVNGCLLQDEFAITQRALGNNCADIHVPKECLREAKKVLLVMQESGKLMAADEDSSQERD